MAALLLDPDEVASERQVILEEIAMYDSEPWDALEMAVHERLYGPHPYGRQVLRQHRNSPTAALTLVLSDQNSA